MNLLNFLKRSLFIAEDVKKGEALTSKNVRSVRPGFGIAPKYLAEILGKRAKIDLAFGTPLAFEHIQGY